MNKQELRELILDQKEQGKASFNQLDDDKQNVMVSAMITRLPQWRRWECMEDMSYEYLEKIIAANRASDYLALGKAMSEVLRGNMQSACEAEYESAYPDYESAHIDAQIDRMKEREAVV